MSAAELRSSHRRAPGRWDAAPTAYPAHVHLCSGKVYEGHAVVSAGAVTMMDAKLRHHDVHGMRRYPARAQTWPWRVVSKIKWAEPTAAP